MIELQSVSKRYFTPIGEKTILQSVSMTFPARQSVGILGKNGAGKSTLLRMIAGSEPISSGRIVRRGRLSWPLGFSGGFNGSLSGEENLRFVCRIYDQPIGKVRAFVREFSELGADLARPICTYSSGMKARLAFALSMAIDFDCYLIDEITGVGDRAFQQKCEKAFEDRRAHASVILVSHSFATLKRYCQSGVVLHQGTLTAFPDIQDAIDHYLEVTA